MNPAPETALDVAGLQHAYGSRTALAGVSFRVDRGEIFALLGPNGGGKTTLFRILTTLMRPGGGTACVLGHNVVDEPAQVRKRIGVVFQQPSLDPKLTVTENLIHHGRMYAMRGAELRRGAAAQLKSFNLDDRQGDLAETLSGGLQRRVELAKALLPEPDLLFLDEPSTGLDPGARIDFAAELARMRRERGTTVILTTHFMEEADRCDRVGIIHEGHLVALGAPEELKKSVGGDVVAIETEDTEWLGGKLRESFGLEAQAIGGTLRVEMENAHTFIPQIAKAFPDKLRSITLGRPTLEDVFVKKTGRRFSETHQNKEAHP